VGRVAGARRIVDRGDPELRASGTPKLFGLAPTEPLP
jgi:hypothetical protein